MRRFLVALILTLWTGVASAASLYVDNSCANNGDGTTDACAGSPGGAGRYNNLQSALTAAVAGDEIIVAAGSGDYVTANGTGYTTATGFAFANSGTDGNPITLRNKAGDRPVLRACASSATALSDCNRATISANEKAYIEITSDDCPTSGPVTLGFHVYGLIIFYSGATTEGTMPHGNKVSCVEAERGYSTADDGNWSTLWVQGQYGFEAHHNYFHDVTYTGLTGSGSQSSTSGVKMFQTSNSTFYRSTIDTVESTQAGGFDCKADCVNDTFYENDIRSVSICFRVENQETPGGPYTTNGATGSVFRNNVCTGLGDRGAVRLEDGIITDVTIYNNTFVDFLYAIEDTHSSAGDCGGVVFYNNASVSPTTRHYDLLSNAPCTFGTPVDYNVFDSAVGFRYNSTAYASLALWQASNGSAFDQGSSDLATASFLFTGGTDYTLQAGSPLQGAGHVGGVSGGAAVDVGAYTDTITCVGYACGAAATPIRLRIRGADAPQ